MICTCGRHFERSLRGLICDACLEKSRGRHPPRRLHVGSRSKPEPIVEPPQWLGEWRFVEWPSPANADEPPPERA